MSFLARIRGVGGDLITRASISDISYAVRDLTEATTTATGTLDVETVVFNDLQQSDYRWTKDSRFAPSREDGLWGYNFAATLAYTLFDDRDIATTAPYEVTLHDFRVDFLFVGSDTTRFMKPFLLRQVVESYV